MAIWLLEKKFLGSESLSVSSMRRQRGGLRESAITWTVLIETRGATDSQNCAGSDRAGGYRVDRDRSPGFGKRGCAAAGGCSGPGRGARSHRALLPRLPFGGYAVSLVQLRGAGLLAD